MTIDLDSTAAFVAQQCAWKRQSRKKSLLASRRKLRPSSACCWRELQLEAENAALRARIEELERQAKGKTPQNSSLPPSTRHPHARPQSPKGKSKRKRGGQPGHEKHERPLIPTEQCDDTLPLRPSECRRCGAEPSRATIPPPWRHQVWELPEIKPLVTEYQLHRLICPCCGETTCAELPPGVPQGQSGPR